MRTILALLSIAAFSSVRAQQPPSAATPTVILFVGNSFTFGGDGKIVSYNKASVTDEPPGFAYVGGIPGIFKKLADEAGLHFEVHVETVAGKDLEFHYQNALPLISQAKWDAVVLQGYSSEATPSVRGGKPESFVKHAIMLEKAIHAARTDAKVYLYETWPYLYKPYPDNPSNHTEALATMAEDLLAGYRQAFTQDGHFERLIPVGEAWMRAIRSGTATDDPRSPLKPGQVNLWEKDNKHPDAEGSYLAALTLLDGITGIDVRKFGSGEQAAHDLGIAPEIAVKLRAFAAETVQSK